ncbi:MAG: biotin--[acetyl-CoA-carboxylase] ligase [Vulcanibacillus sp.]
MEKKIELNTNWLGRNILYYQILDSTQSMSHIMATNQSPHGTIIIAEEQTDGRGRLGRVWYSEKEKGIWMSIILRPAFNIQSAPQITLLTSIIVQRTLKKMFDIDSKIKWPNDIYIDHRKCAGILCEVKGDLNNYYLVVGIGINTHKTEYQDVIKNKAISIEEKINHSPKRLEIIIELINEFEKSYDSFQQDGLKIFREEYIDVMYGLNYKILYNNIIGYIKGIDENGHLLVREEDGNFINVSSGEIKFLF